MRFVQGFTYGEWSFDLMWANDQYHSFVNKVGSQQAHSILTFADDNAARHWHTTFAADCIQQIDEGVMS